MKTVSALRVTAGLGAAALTAGLLLAPASAAVATPSPVRPGLSIAACEVADATLTWGTIERWRSYIQGSIAHGGWAEEGDVSYELPHFVWSGGNGILAVDGTTGTVKFDGAVHFTGHDDLLQVDLGNPTLEIIDDEEAYLVLDLSSTKQDGQEDIVVTQERAVKLDIAGTVSADGNTLTLTDVPGKLTAEGAAAFGGFYAAGEAVDPVTVEIVSANDCAFVDGGAPAPETPAPETPSAESPTAESPLPEAPAIPWAPIVIGGVALLVIVGAGVMLATGRKKPESTDEES